MLISEMLQQTWGSVFRIVAASILILTVMLFGAPAQTNAAINSQINFQGKLTNPDGTNVTNNTYSIVFSLYTVDTAGTALWSETQNVSVTNGIFNVALGSVSALPGSVDFNGSSLYLGVKVGADAEMTPRIRFTAAPYAFNSDKLGGFSSDGFVQLANGIQTDSSSTNASIAINKTGTTANIMTIQRNGNAVMTLGNNGSATFRNQADSATAFVVQDSSGADLVNVDSTNRRLIVGSATNDAVAVLLVLDQYNQATDPTGVNGAMYYNSNAGRNRCYENGAWYDCLAGYSRDIVLKEGLSTASAVATNLALNTLNCVSDPSLRAVVNLRGMTKIRFMGRFGGAVAAATTMRIQYNTNSDPSIATGDAGWTTLSTSAGNHTVNVMFYTAEANIPSAAQINDVQIRACIFSGNGTADPTITAARLNAYQ